MKYTTTIAIIALVASFALGPQVATAQQHGHRANGSKNSAFSQHMMNRGMMRGGMMGHMMQGGMMGRNCPMMGMMMGGSQEKFAAGRIAFLKAELAITAAQTNVFENYATALKANLDQMHGMRQSMMGMMSAKSPVERLDAHLNMMDKRAASLKQLKPALAALYDALNEAQKKKANAILTGMGCMM